MTSFPRIHFVAFFFLLTWLDSHLAYFWQRFTCALQSKTSHESVFMKPNQEVKYCYTGTFLPHCKPYSTPPPFRGSEAQNCSTMDSAFVAVYAEQLGWERFFELNIMAIWVVACVVKVQPVHTLYVQRHLQQHKEGERFYPTADAGILDWSEDTCHKIDLLL